MDSKSDDRKGVVPRLYHLNRIRWVFPCRTMRPPLQRVAMLWTLLAWAGKDEIYVTWCGMQCLSWKRSLIALEDGTKNGRCHPVFSCHIADRSFWGLVGLQLQETTQERSKELCCTRIPLYKNFDWMWLIYLSIRNAAWYRYTYIHQREVAVDLLEPNDCHQQLASQPVCVYKYIHHAVYVKQYLYRYIHIRYRSSDVYSSLLKNCHSSEGYSNSKSKKQERIRFWFLFLKLPVAKQYTPRKTKMEQTKGLESGRLFLFWNGWFSGPMFIFGEVIGMKWFHLLVQFLFVKNGYCIKSYRSTTRSVGCLSTLTLDDLWTVGTQKLPGLTMKWWITVYKEPLLQWLTSGSQINLNMKLFDRVLEKI